jgi:hypothetical protein
MTTTARSQPSARDTGCRPVRLVSETGLPVNRAPSCPQAVTTTQALPRAERDIAAGGNSRGLIR